MTLPTIATFDDLNRGAFRQVVAYYANDQDYVTQRLTAASQWVERSCERRLMPFTGLVQTRVAQGVRADRGRPGSALTMVSGLALTTPTGLSSPGPTCRDFWVDETGVWAPELWAYTGITVDLRYPWSTGTYRVPASAVSGPAVDTGHVTLGPGVDCPPGTEVTITYGGGYNTTGGGYPLDLVEAVRTETIRQLIVELDPELTPGLSGDVLERDTDRKLCRWRRRCSCGQNGKGHK